MVLGEYNKQFGLILMDWFNSCLNLLFIMLFDLNLLYSNVYIGDCCILVFNEYGVLLVIDYFLFLLGQVVDFQFQFGVMNVVGQVLVFDKIGNFVLIDFG